MDKRSAPASALVVQDQAELPRIDLEGVDALIFDVDGTLAETEELHRQAFNRAFAEIGLGWSWDVPRYRDLLRIHGGVARIAAYQKGRADALPPERVRALHRRKTELFQASLAQARLSLRPGVQPLIERARRGELRLGVATTTSRINVDAVTRACWGRPAAELFDAVAAGDEVAARKPAPDVYLLALARLGLPAARCLAIEDSLPGLQAAQAAGLRAVVTPSAYTQGDFA